MNIEQMIEKQKCKYDEYEKKRFLKLICTHLILEKFRDIIFYKCEKTPKIYIVYLHKQMLIQKNGSFFDKNLV